MNLRAEAIPARAALVAVVPNKGSCMCVVYIPPAESVCVCVCVRVCVCVW